MPASRGIGAVSCVIGRVSSFLLPAAPGPATYHLFQNVLKALMQGIREEARLVKRRPGIPGTVIRLSGPRGSIELGGRAFVVMAGPCAVESAAQVEEAA